MAQDHEQSAATVPMIRPLSKNDECSKMNNPRRSKLVDPGIK